MTVEQKMTLPKPDLVRTARVPKIIDVGRSKLSEWIAKGYFPVYRPEGQNSRTTYVRLSEVEQFITTGKPVVPII